MERSDLFYGTSGPRSSPNIAVVGEAWGKEELVKQLPLVGGSGQLFDKMLEEAGLSRDDCFVTNMTPRLQIQAPNDKKAETRNFFHKTAEKTEPFRGLRPQPETLRDIRLLYKQLAAVRPKVIIALGNYALWLLTNGLVKISTEGGIKVPGGIGVWRGSYLFADGLASEMGDPSLASIPVIPIYHPAAILNQWVWRQPTVHDLRIRVEPLSKTGVGPLDQRSVIIKPSFEKTLSILEMLSNLPANHQITCDVETCCNHIDSIGFAWSASEAICIPLCSIFSGKAYWSFTEECAIHAAIRKLFARADLFWSNQNIVYDLQYLDLFCYSPPRPKFDTMVAHHLVFPGTPKSLDYLSSLYCEYHRYWGEASDHTTDEQRWRYNGLDCCTTWEITSVLREVVAGRNIGHLFQERLDVMYEVAFPMMCEGIRLDTEERNRQALDLVQAMQVYHYYLESVMPDNIKKAARGPTATSPWYTSPPQQMVIFYDIFDCTEVKDPKTKRRTVGDDALPKIMAEEPLLIPIIETLQTYRSMANYNSNIMQAQLDWDGRMRSSFDITGTETFRWNSSKSCFHRGMNLMNIPKEKGE